MVSRAREGTLPGISYLRRFAKQEILIKHKIDSAKRCLSFYRAKQITRLRKKRKRKQQKYSHDTKSFVFFEGIVSFACLFFAQNAGIPLSLARNTRPLCFARCLSFYRAKQTTILRKKKRKRDTKSP